MQKYKYLIHVIKITSGDMYASKSHCNVYKVNVSGKRIMIKEMFNNFNKYIMKIYNF